MSRSSQPVTAAERLSAKHLAVGASGCRDEVEDGANGWNIDKNWVRQQSHI
jgi:hypothetical protein